MLSKYAIAFGLAALSSGAVAQQSTIELYYGLGKSSQNPFQVDIDANAFHNYYIVSGKSNPTKEDEAAFILFPDNDLLGTTDSFLLAVNQDFVKSSNLQNANGIVFLGENHDPENTKCLFIPRGYNAIYHNGSNGTFDRLSIFLDEDDSLLAQENQCIAVERRVGAPSI